VFLKISSVSLVPKLPRDKHHQRGHGFSPSRMGVNKKELPGLDVIKVPLVRLQGM
jgi:hypothetical protein